MTFQKLGQALSFPKIPQTSGGLASTYGVAAAVTVDADGEALAVIFKSTVTENITKIKFRTGSVTTGGDLDIRVETVSGGEPTGTLWATTTNIVHAVGSGDDNVEIEVTLTSAASVTAGDLVALVVTRPVGSAFVGSLVTTTGAGLYGFPTSLAKTATYNANQNASIIRPYFNTSGYINILGVNNFYDGATTESVSTSTTPDVVGNVINLPYDFRVSHLWAAADFDGACDILLIDSDGSTTLGSVSNPATQPNLASASLNIIPLTTPVDCDANTDYRVVLNPTTATGSALKTLIFGSSADRLAQDGMEFVKYTSAKDPTGSGSYTNDLTKVALVGIFVSHVDIPAGGGGLAGNPVGGFIS